MKYIHSVWSQKPLNNNYNINNFYSYLLSALLIKKHGHKIELFCDESLSEMFSLIPYDKINIVDFNADRINQYFWIWGKIKTQELINEPYVHVDGDVFLFNDIIKNIQNDVIVQSQEDNKTMGYSFENTYRKSLSPLKNFSFGVNWDKYNTFAYNCGVVGFNNIELKNEYIKKAKQIVKTLSCDIKINEYINGYRNMLVVIEQALLYYYVKEYNVNPFEIIPYDEIIKHNYDWFNTIPIKIGYCHMWGCSKFKNEILEKIKLNVKKHFPNNYKSIIKFENQYK